MKVTPNEEYIFVDLRTTVIRKVTIKDVEYQYVIDNNTYQTKRNMIIYFSDRDMKCYDFRNGYYVVEKYLCNDEFIPLTLGTLLILYGDKRKTAKGLLMGTIKTTKLLKKLPTNSAKILIRMYKENYKILLKTIKDGYNNF